MKDKCKKTGWNSQHNSSESEICISKCKIFRKLTFLSYLIILVLDTVPGWWGLAVFLIDYFILFDNAVDAIDTHLVICIFFSFLTHVLLSLSTYLLPLVVCCCSLKAIVFSDLSLLTPLPWKPCPHSLCCYFSVRPSNDYSLLICEALGEIHYSYPFIITIYLAISSHAYFSSGYPSLCCGEKVIKPLLDCYFEANVRCNKRNFSAYTFDFDASHSFCESDQWPCM